MGPKKSAAVITGLALLGYAGLRGKLRRYEIVESSMEPHLRPGDYVVAQHRTGVLERGDIVIFDHPDAPGYELTKRVVGLPGEEIVISNGQVHVDGAVLAESWADGVTLPDSEWSLGGDVVFVLGDNRAASSADSRTIGPVQTTAIRWRVVARYWPAAAVGRITAPA
jgi:signal peptidase I